MTSFLSTLTIILYAVRREFRYFAVQKLEGLSLLTIGKIMVR